jgi:CRP-like cAMP-binding protein
MSVSDINRFPNFEYLGDAVPYIERIGAIVEHIHLFEDFEAGEIARLAPYLRCYRAPGGAEIIREGDDGDFMMLLLDGTVEILKVDPVTDLPVRVGLAGPGKILGEMSLIDGEPRFASCISMGSLLFAVLDRETMSRIIADESRIGIKLLMQLILLLNQRLRHVSNELMQWLGQGRVTSIKP